MRKLASGLLAALPLLLAHGAASAATYGITGGTYTSRNAFQGPCNAPSCANYTAAMRGQGSFQTAAPLPPNLANAAIKPLITAFSFTDGLTTFASGDPDVRLGFATVSTDATGALTGIAMIVQRFQVAGGPTGHEVGDHVDEIDITTTRVYGYHDGLCSLIGTLQGTADVCTSIDFNPSLSYSNGPMVTLTSSLTPGPVGTPATVQSVPALSPWALALLAGAVALSGLVWRERRG